MSSHNYLFWISLGCMLALFAAVALVKLGFWFTHGQRTDESPNVQDLPRHRE